MKKHQHIPPRSQDAKTMARRLDAVPAINKLSDVGELAALTASYRLRANNPQLREQIRILINSLTDEIIEQLDKDPETDDLIVTELEIKGVVAKVFHRATAALALGVGDSLLEAHALSEQFTLSELGGLEPVSGIVRPQVPEAEGL